VNKQIYNSFGPVIVPSASSTPLSPRPVTLTAVARAARVSPGAVSSFFSNRLYGETHRHGIGLSQESRARIVAAARSLGYRPADPALLVRIYPERGGLCFLLNERVKDGPANPYFGRILHGVTQRVSSGGGHVSFAHYDPTLDYLLNPERLPGLVREGGASRCILAGQINHSLLLALQQRGLAVACCSRLVPAAGVTSIVPDYARAAELALAHLFELGHRRIAVLAEHYFLPQEFNYSGLVAGAARAFAAHGLAWREQDIVRTECNGQWADPLRPLFSRALPPTALFCLDDWTATGALLAARHLGLDVPGKVSIVGCNDESRNDGTRPGLTTVHFPLEEIGAQAVDALAPVDGARTDTLHRLITLPVHLVVRETSAQPPPVSPGP
jgi:DNA-binding LacI/PurR family transcriptional regulator